MLDSKPFAIGIECFTHLALDWIPDRTQNSLRNPSWLGIAGQLGREHLEDDHPLQRLIAGLEHDAKATFAHGRGRAWSKLSASVIPMRPWRLGSLIRLRELPT